jgi:hypothetical protein
MTSNPSRTDVTTAKPFSILLHMACSNLETSVAELEHKEAITNDILACLKDNITKLESTQTNPDLLRRYRQQQAEITQHFTSQLQRPREVAIKACQLLKVADQPSVCPDPLNQQATPASPWRLESTSARPVILGLPQGISTPPIEFLQQ